MFYQNGSGIRGAATLNSIDRIPTSERPLMASIGVERFRVKLSFQTWHTFTKPVPLRSLVHGLNFVANKAYWGHSLRGGPRPIDEHDYYLIMNAAAATECATPDGYGVGTVQSAKDSRPTELST